MEHSDRDNSIGFREVEYRALGPLSVAVDGEDRKLGGPRQRMVLAVLLTNANNTVSQDALIEEVWAGEPPEAAKSTLQSYIYGLRNELGADAITRHSDGYRVEVDEETFDVLRFEAMVSEARQQVSEEPLTTAKMLKDALALWYGKPYGDLDNNPSLALETARLSELRLAAVESRIEADLAAGNHSAVIAELETLIREHPLRERFRAQQMLALYRSGRQAEALRAYEKTRVYLVEELGIDPSSELRDLEQRILDQDPSLNQKKAPDRQTLAFLFTDIEGSTFLWGIGGDTAREAIDSQDHIITQSVETNQGSVFKRTGDGLYASFPDVAQARAAASEAQLELATHDWGEAGEVKVRMAIDVGLVEVRGNDFQGEVLHRVSRILPLGHGGQVLLSAEARSALDDESAILALGEYRLQGIGRPESIYQLLGPEIEAEFPPLRVDRSPPPTPVSSEGRMVRGYELRDPLGEGDFGTVYRAFQPAVGREVAIKVIRTKYASRGDFISRFEREAQIVAQLEHPHIVQLFDYWRDPDGAYLVMPFLRGGSLAQALRRGGWNLSPALRLVEQIGNALGYAHRRGVIHRDVKPGNVLLDEEGNAYLSDFGIATRLTDDADTPMTTSLAFVPPEELRGEKHTVRSDVFSLGVLIFHLLTGVTPRSELPLPTLSEVRPGLPAEIDGVISRATEPDPSARFERVDDFVRALRQAAGADVVGIADQIEPGPSQEPIRNPYKGLRAFKETDALDFFGRDALVEELLQAVAQHNFVAVVGPSGSGKSSVIHAGLIPALRAGGVPGSRQWLIADMYPGSFPFEELEAALLRAAVDRPSDLLTELQQENGLLRVSKQILPGDDATLLLVIDQFEEVFSAVSSETNRRLFLDNLVAVARDERSRVRVVLTMRADFFNQSLEYAEFAEVLRHRMVTVGAPTQDGLAQGISAPARAVGVDLEPGLVGRITSDVEDQPGGLPLLQYALTEMFARREGETLTTEDYERTGGVLGALGQRAEEVYQGLPESGREAVRQLFMRLVSVDETAADTRRRARRSELRSLEVDQDALDQAINQLGGYRLLSFDRDPVTRGPSIEVAHEALLREWDRLAGWIDERREELILARRIGASAREWAESDNDPSFLLRGGRLEQAEAWLESTDIAPTGDEVEYVDASREQRLAEEAASERRRRWTVGALSAGLVALAILAGFAIVQRGAAQAEARQETIRQLAASSTVALQEDPELAILLALEAADISREVGDPVRSEAVAALHQAVQTSRLELRFDEFTTVAFNRDGTLVTADHLAPLDAVVTELAPHPDGRLLAGILREGVELAPRDVSDRMIVWDMATGEEVIRLLPTTDVSSDDVVGIYELAWSPDGGSIVATIFNRAKITIRVTVWELTSGEEVLSAPGRMFVIPAFVDSHVLAIPESEAERVVFYDIATGDQVDHLDTPGFAPEYLDFDPLRDLLVMGSATSFPIQAWDLDSKELVWSESIVNSLVPNVHSENGVVALTGWDGVVRLLDLDDGSELGVLLGHTGETHHFPVSFSLDGRMLASTSTAETLVWDITPAGPEVMGAVALGLDPPLLLTLSPEGDQVAVLYQGRVQSFDLTTGEEASGRVAGAPINWDLPAPVSADWRLVAALDDDGQGWVRDFTTGEVVMEMPPCTIPMAFSSDGSALVVDGVRLCAPGEVREADFRSRVISVPSGEELVDLGALEVWGHGGSAFNPAGLFEADRYLAVGRVRLLEIYDMSDGRLVTTLDAFEEWEDGVLGVGFDPSGRYLAVGGGDIHGWVLDVEQIAAGAPAADALVFDRPVDPGGLPDLVVNADGIMATSGAGSLRLWDIHSGEQLIQIPVNLDQPVWAAFTLEGDHLLYVDLIESGYVLRRFPLDPDELIALAESRLTRGFTAEECTRYDLDC